MLASCAHPDVRVCHMLCPGNTVCHMMNTCCVICIVFHWLFEGLLRIWCKDSFHSNLHTQFIIMVQTTKYLHCIRIV